MNNEVTTRLHIYNTAANHQQNRVALRFKIRNGAEIDGLQLQIPPAIQRVVVCVTPVATNIRQFKKLGGIA